MKKYEPASVEVVEFKAQDIITGSLLDPEPVEPLIPPDDFDDE